MVNRNTNRTYIIALVYNDKTATQLRRSVLQDFTFPGVNLIKLLQVLFTSVAIVLGSENNRYTC